ncbi:hypothetical protein [Thermogymnomonas acidicola]|uniref:hypothetical protein n=1 Tax=Thermogymnomonas acidicola TaxID=399579 RepID=UPI0013968F22|nr:hypothetical protein [Thermogymnomonas acidicola]
MLPFILYGSSGENFAAEADYIMSAFGLSGQPWDGTVRVPEHFRPAAPPKKPGPPTSPLTQLTASCTPSASHPWRY